MGILDEYELFDDSRVSWDDLIHLFDSGPDLVEEVFAGNDRWGWGYEKAILWASGTEDDCVNNLAIACGKDVFC
jgi:hypothetical protein